MNELRLELEQCCRTGRRASVLPPGGLVEDSRRLRRRMAHCSDGFLCWSIKEMISCLHINKSMRALLEVVSDFLLLLRLPPLRTRMGKGGKRTSAARVANSATAVREARVARAVRPQWTHLMTHLGALAAAGDGLCWPIKSSCRCGPVHRLRAHRL